MAIDDELLQEVRGHLSEMSDIVEKPMVGGIGLMWRGNLLCGVMGGDLLVRVAKEEAERFIGDDGATPMAMGGRSARSWLLVPKSSVSGRPEMGKWIDRAIEFVASLPSR